METYITLFNYTDKGVANIKEAPERISQARQAIEQAGGKWVGWYLTLGQYDGLVIAQAPDAKAAAGVLLALGSLGRVRTETLRAFTESEFGEIVAAMP